jgi:hypothetical protein
MTAYLLSRLAGNQVERETKRLCRRWQPLVPVSSLFSDIACTFASVLSNDRSSKRDLETVPKMAAVGVVLFAIQ